MTDKQVRIDRSNTIQTRDELIIGMPLWIVGQGGVTSVSKPYFAGFLAGFAYLNYGEDGYSYFQEEEEDFITVIALKGLEPSIDEVIEAKRNLSIPRNGFHPGHRTKAPENCYFVNMSLKDRNIEGGGYNNWYFTKSEKDGMVVYNEMLEKWSDEYEQERN